MQNKRTVHAFVHTSVHLKEFCILKPVSIRLFGTFEVQINEEPLRKLRTHRGQVVLAQLALKHGKPVDRASLAANIWPESDPSDAMYSLRRTLTDLRQALGDYATAIQSPTQSTLQLCSDTVWTDVAEFDSVIRSADDSSLGEAMNLYRGPLLNDWRQDWVVLERAVKERTLIEALVRQSERSEERGDSNSAAEALRHLFLLDPHDEATFRRLATNLRNAGNLSGAQKAYEEFKRRLRLDLDIQPAEQTQELMRELLASSSRTLDSSRFVGGSLPAPTSPLVGRRTELIQALDALTTHRMLTLVGVGGVGKTRLALEIVRELASHQGYKAVAVDLLAVRDAERLHESLASAAKSLDPDSNSSPSLIVNRLADVEAILLLDNCEHLLDPVRILVKEILDICPKVRILATSQASIGSPEEMILRISPMEVPDPDQVSLEQAFQSDAIKLMVQCISRTKGAFELSEKNFNPLCRICGMLQGVPLALELAATRTKLLSLEQVATLLEDRFRLLRTTEKGIEERHRTLQATMDWSYSLLSEGERSLLQTVSVFAGNWTSESAARIHGSSDDYEVLELLEKLVDRSLVLSDPSEDLPKFRLLDSVRQYGIDRLREQGELDNVRDRHLNWFARLSELAERAFPGKDQRIWVERIAIEYENIAAAISWARTSPSRSSYALRIVGSLMRYWWIRGELTTGRETVSKVLDVSNPTDHPVPYAKALYALGALAWSQGDNTESTELQLQALEIFEANNEIHAASGCLRNLSQAARNQGRDADSIAYGERALDGYRRSGDEVLEACVLVDLGLALFDIMRFDEAKKYLQQAITYSRIHGVLSLEGVACLNYGSVCHAQLKFAEARSAFEQALEVYEQVGGLILKTMAKNGLAVVCAELGEVERARHLLAPSIETFSKLGEKKGVCLAIEATGYIAQCAGEPELAARLMGATDALRETLDIPRAPAECPEFARCMSKLNEALGSDRVRELVEDGMAAPVTEIVEEAKQWANR